MKLPLVMQYLALVDKIVERPDGYPETAVRLSLLEKWSEAEENPGLTITEKGRVRRRVLDAIAELERPRVRERVTTLEEPRA